MKKKEITSTNNQESVDTQPTVRQWIKPTFECTPLNEAQTSGTGYYTLDSAAYYS